tara:strand:+ start:332 stop:904 length:573 start_codon:yes stop_codon:yes gene_type:complete
MKKLFLYVFLVLIWCNVGFTATLISLADLKLNENINNYFFNQEITEYNYEGEGYGTDSVYSVLFIPQSKLKNKEYDSITIAINNNSKKISYYAGFVEKFKNLNKCLEYRDKQVLKNKYKFLLHDRDDQTNTHSDGLIQKTVRFISIKSSAAFSCDYFEDQKNSNVNYRFDVLTDEFNNWVQKLNKTETTN